jgi:hypothetical protein
MRRFFPVLLVLALSACNGASIPTQWKLRKFNIASADLAQTRFALAGPPWTTVTPENTVIEVSYWRDGDDAAEAKSLALRLRKAAHVLDNDALSEAGAPSLAVIELAPASLAAARAEQREAALLRTEGAKMRGKIHLSGALGCRRGQIPPGPIPIDLFIHADDETGWLPLYAGFDVRDQAADPAVLDEALPPCLDKTKSR